MSAHAVPVVTVADHKWHDRLVVVFAPEQADARLTAQRAEWRRLGSGAAERDLHLVEVIGVHVAGASDRAADLRARFQVEPATFAALLIGKDGHVALHRNAPLTAAHLTAIIDAMPMRRDEVRRRP